MKIQLYHFSLKKTVFFPIFLLFLQVLYCADYFEEGKRLLLEDRPGEAVTAFFAASKESTVPPSINLYLGVSYLRLGKYNEALSYLSLGRKTDAVNSYLYSYNMGNIFRRHQGWQVWENVISGYPAIMRLCGHKKKIFLYKLCTLRMELPGICMV